MKEVYVGGAELIREKGEIKVLVTESSQAYDGYQIVTLNDENKFDNKELFMAAVMKLQGKSGLIGPIQTNLI